MVNISRDFESELLHELKFFARCTRKSKDPNHFCNNREFQKNLRMSARDVGKNLSNLVSQGKITHDQVTYNGKQRDKFTVIDPRMYSSKDIIDIYKGYINNQLVQLEFHADKMKKRPAYYDVEMTPLRPFPQLQVFESGKYPMIPQTTLKLMRRPTQMTSKINEKGFEYLVTFGESVNQIFSYCDSLTYSQFVKKIKEDDEHNKMIFNLKRQAFHKIQGLIKHILKDLPYLQKQAIGHAIESKIPMLNQMIQVERFTRL